MPQLSWEETRSIMAEVQELFAGREVGGWVHCCPLGVMMRSIGWTIDWNGSTASSTPG